MEGRAYMTVPPELEITFSTIPGAGLGIMSKAFIPKHTWLAEYEGTTARPKMRHLISSYAWTVSYWKFFLIQLDRLSNKTCY